MNPIQRYNESNYNNCLVAGYFDSKKYKELLDEKIRYENEQKNKNKKDNSHIYVLLALAVVALYLLKKTVL